MNRRSFAKSLAVVVPMVVASGCETLSKQSVARVNDLVGWVERIYVDAELSKERLRGAIETLQAIVSPDFAGDSVEGYAEFLAAMNGADEQAEKLRVAIRSTKRTASAVFEQWAEHLEEFSSVAMRQRSQTRLADTTELYEAIVATADPALAAFDGFNRALRDHALFLGNDFNPAAVTEIRDDVRALARDANLIDSKFNACLEASRAYVESAGLSVRASGEPDPPPVRTRNPPRDKQPRPRRGQQPRGARPR